MIRMMRKLTAALLVPITTACTTVAPVANPREFIPIKRPNEVWLQRKDGTTVVMYRPVLKGDTVFGVVRGQGQRGIARSEITGVQAAQPAPDKTRFMLMGGSALVGAGLFWAIRHTNSSSAPPSYKDFCSFDPDDCGV